ncbi:MAG: 2-dehydropantoate 2-reductase [Rhodospirillales bacterium]|nr:2-dehydropantoate 2-reductase [Rhodospirillales bacterium]
MKIAVFGTGGVGGYFGGRLAASGEDVRFVARGAHLQAIRKGGLRIKSALGDVTIDAAQATDDPADIGHADIALVAVKLYDTEDAARAMKPLVGPQTTVVSFQNGVGARDVFSAAFGAERVIGGTTSIAAVIGEPGVITHTGTMASMAFGEWDGNRSARTESLLAACEKAGIDVTLSPNINGAIWSKFVFLAAFSGITSHFRLPIGPIREDEEKRAMFRDAIAETFAVGRAKGVSLSDNLVEKRMVFADGLPEEMYSSMYHDLAAGKRIEVKWLSGAVVDMGEDLGIDTPTHRIFLEALLPFSEGT